MASALSVVALAVLSGPTGRGGRARCTLRAPVCEIRAEVAALRQLFLTFLLLVQAETCSYRLWYNCSCSWSRHNRSRCASAARVERPLAPRSMPDAGLTYPSRRRHHDCARPSNTSRTARRLPAPRGAKRPPAARRRTHDHHPWRLDRHATLEDPTCSTTAAHHQPKHNCSHHRPSRKFPPPVRPTPLDLRSPTLCPRTPHAFDPLPPQKMTLTHCYALRAQRRGRTSS